MSEFNTRRDLETTRATTRRALLLVSDQRPTYSSATRERKVGRNESALFRRLRERPQYERSRFDPERYFGGGYFPGLVVGIDQPAA